MKARRRNRNKNNKRICAYAIRVLRKVNVDGVSKHTPEAIRQMQLWAGFKVTAR